VPGAALTMSTVFCEGEVDAQAQAVPSVFASACRMVRGDDMLRDRLIIGDEVIRCDRTASALCATVRDPDQ